MKSRVRVDGLRDLDKALSALGKSAARTTLKRVLLKGGEPIAEAARSKAPHDQGKLRASIIVSARTNNPSADAAFAKAMQAGLGTAAAVAAKRTALRISRANGDSSFAMMFVGPSNLPSAHLVEFGTGPHEIRAKAGSGLGRLSFTDGDHRVTPLIVNHPGSAPHPFMRPAFEEKKHEALEIIGQTLGAEIMKTAQRQARRAAKLAAKLKG